MGSAECLFCRIVRGEIAALVVDESEETFTFLDHRPVFPGHALVVPKVHSETMLDLPEPVLARLFEKAGAVAGAAERGLGADGSFVAVNNRISQSVPHVHVHVVPRRKKDGLKGFFWPRHKYESDEVAKQTALLLKTALSNAPR